MDNNDVQTQDVATTQPQEATQTYSKSEYEALEAKYNSLKKSYDTTATQVANYKRAERERMTDDEKRAAIDAERQSELEAVRNELKSIKLKSKLNTFTNDEAQKDEITKLIIDGDITSALDRLSEIAIANQTHATTQLKAELLKQQPIPAPQAEATKIPTSMEEWNKLQQTNPSEYHRLLKQI